MGTSKAAPAGNCEGAFHAGPLCSCALPEVTESRVVQPLPSLEGILRELAEGGAPSRGRTDGCLGVRNTRLVEGEGNLCSVVTSDNVVRPWVQEPVDLQLRCHRREPANRPRACQAVYLPAITALALATSALLCALTTLSASHLR